MGMATRRNERGGKSGPAPRVLLICNKTKCANLVSNVAGARDQSNLGWRRSNLAFRIVAWQWRWCEHEQVEALPDRSSPGIDPDRFCAVGAGGRTEQSAVEGWTGQAGGPGRPPGSRARRTSARAWARKIDTTREGVCRSAILADTSITAARPGRAGAGVMRPTTDATAGGGTSEASGISTRSRWRVRPLMCLTWRSWTIMADRMDRRSARGIHRRRWPMLRLPPPPPPDPGRKRGRWRHRRGAAGWPAHRTAGRRDRRRGRRRYGRRHHRGAGGRATRLLSGARQLLLSLSVGTVRLRRPAQLLLKPVPGAVRHAGRYACLDVDRAGRRFCRRS